MFDRDEKINVESLNNYGLREFQKEIVDTVEAVKEGVVSIIITKDFVLYEQGRASELIKQQVGWWSWILIDEQGYILTNKHVLEDEDSDYVVVYSDGSTSEVKDIWRDDTLDIAIIKVDESEVAWKEPARILDFKESITVGQFALAIGNALAEFQNSVTFWVVSWNNRRLTLENENLYAWLIQTDTSISEGNSWGPLFNIDGKVIGINTAVSAFWENIWFAIPLSQEFVDASIQSVKNYDAIVRPFVWVRYLDLQTGNSNGVEILEVVAGSPAEGIGLQEWDLLTHINDILIDTERSFMYHLHTFLPGDTIKITLLRNGIKQERDLVLWN